jgi:hypothetical protein
MSTKPKKTLTDDVRRRFAHGGPVLEPNHEATTTTGLAGTGRPGAPEGGINRGYAAGEAESGRAPSTPSGPGPEPEPRRLNQSYRLPEPLVLRLQRVGLRRKHAHQKPWSGQDIVAEALTQWLDAEEKRATP